MGKERVVHNLKLCNATVIDHYDEKKHVFTFGFAFPGVKVKVEKQWDARTRSMYLHFSGTATIYDEDFIVDDELYCDLEEYDRYDVRQYLGIIYVDLYQRDSWCKEPEFRRVSRVNEEKKPELEFRKVTYANAAPQLEED